MYFKFIKYLFRRKVSMLLSLTFALVSSAVMLVTPYYTGRAVDRIIAKGNVDFDGVKQIITLLLIMFFVSAVFQWFMTSISTKIACRAACDIRRDAVEKINSMPLSYFDSTPHGDIMSRLTNDIDAVSDGVLQTMTLLFMGIVTFVGSLILMFKLNFLITLVVVIITPFAFVVSSFIAKNISKHFTAQSKTVGELNAMAEEIITNTALMKTYSLENQVVDKFNEINDRLYVCGQKAQWYSSLINPTTRLINNIAYICVGILGAFLALHGEIKLGTFTLSSTMTVGLIAGFLTYASQFARPINDITSVSTQLQSAVASLKRIFEIIEMTPEDNSETQELTVTQGKVVFDNVSFSYDKNKPLIKNLSFTAEPKTVTAIVGTTGAGKTTLVNLLMRFYELDSGKITIDSTDISKVKKDSLRTSFAMVLQDAVLFEGTIKENIAYGKDDATMEEIIAAAKSAHIHKAIMGLEYGYDTPISSAGENLSAGQKQLITIARAMLLKPQMLILDEATSNVDTLTEMYIQQAFEKIMKGKTTFIIAHRLATIRHADKILVMDNGNVVETGTHDELIKKGGKYKEIFESQFKKN